MEEKIQTTTNEPVNIHSNVNFSEYFKTELIEIINELTSILNEAQNKKLPKKKFAQVLSIIENMHDLSMVHGYDSIESIADKMAMTAGQLQIKNRTDGIEAGQDILSGLQAINEIIQTPNPPEQFPAAESPTPEISIVDDITSAAGETKADTKEPESIEEESFFDIKEVDSLIGLVEHPTQSKTAADSPATPSAPIESPASVQINQAFTEVYREEALENLGFIQTAIQQLKKGESPGDAILQLRSAFGALLDIAQSFEVPPLITPLKILAQICETNLAFNQQPSAEILELLAHSELILREYVEEFPDYDVILSNFTDQLQSLNMDELKKELSFSPIKEVPPPQTSTKPTIKAKLTLSKEAIRRRWILK